MAHQIRYILFEWMTLLYRLIPPHIYIAVCVASWGLIASLQSVTNSFSAMLILRALLGVSEAAFGPGVPFYLSFFYKRDELALRTGLFISAAPLATSFASSLAWVITKAGKRNQISPWRMLFLLEGFPSMVVAVFAWYWIPDSPETARYLIQREKEVAKVRLGIEKEHESDGGKGKGLNIKEILTTLVDPKCYFTAVSIMTMSASRPLIHSNRQCFLAVTLRSPVYQCSFPPSLKSTQDNALVTSTFLADVDPGWVILILPPMVSLLLLTY